MRLALVSKKNKVLYFLPVCFYQDKMVLTTKTPSMISIYP